jgi:ubiquinone/menaquinone biosynthesis C-methylase UbiE
LLDEKASAGRENLDFAHVARYDSKEDACAAAEAALLVEFGLNTESIVVEIGVGTGQFSLAVAPNCARVIAVDVSPPMLARLRSNVAAAGLENVEVVEAGFVSYDHSGPPADFVYSRYAMHHLPDFWKSVALAGNSKSMCVTSTPPTRGCSRRCSPASVSPLSEPITPTTQCLRNTFFAECE